VTGDEREHDEQGQPPAVEPPRAVVVAVDPARLDLYARTLRMAQVPTRATLDLDEAEALLIEHQPSVLVLDHGLPRIYILRLFGLVRETLEGPRVKVLFVGQEASQDGDSSSDDYYLPGEPSPLGVAAQVIDMVAEADAASTEPPPATGPQSEMESEEAVGPVLAPAALDAAANVNETGDHEDRAPELVGAGAGAPAASASIPEPPGTGAPARPRRRFDVIMFRVGMILLILGGLLAFVRPESFTLPMTPPPTVAPAPPTQPPAASPSPAALFEDAVLRLRVSERPRSSAQPRVVNAAPHIPRNSGGFRAQAT
jgi:hypothetical protein